MNRTFILILVLIISAAGLIALSINTQTPVQPAATPSVAQTTLSLTQPQAVPATSNYQSNVVINTGGNKATAAQIELTYDPSVISVADITPGTFFKSPDELFKRIDSQSGRISYAVGAGLGQKGISGQGVVATITFTKLQATGTTTIGFNAKSLVSAEGVLKSVLFRTIPVTFSLSSTSAAPATGTPSAR